MEKLAISATEAAKLIGVSRTTVYELAKTDSFPAFKVGERVLISVEGLAEWVKQQAGGAADVKSG